jgi:hypothetical protein
MVYGWFAPGDTLFQGKLASDIVQAMRTNTALFARSYSLESNMRFAAQGMLLVAGVTGDPHGHVNVIAPIDRLTPGDAGNWSDTFGAWVPWCANVGVRNQYGVRLSRFFRTYPEIYIYLGK